MPPRASTLVAVLALASLPAASCTSSCSRSLPAESSAPRPTASDASIPVAPTASPLSQAALPTTAGSIAMDNLAGQIHSYERLLAADPKATSPLANLVGLYSARGQILGRLADHDRALDAAERLVKLAPREGDPLLLRAGALAALHRFDEAERDLAAAARLGAASDRQQSLRATIAQATGRYDEALALRRQLASARPHVNTLGALAALLGELGDTDEAERTFTAAQHHFPDVAPFPIAWLWLQQGTLWQREGSLGRARELLQAAVDRLPVYAAAISHLAAVEAATGDPAHAIARLEPLVAASDDPEYMGQLAPLLRDAGRSADADALRARARAGYDALLQRHPAAFASHAARFFLGDGQDAARALTLAEQELARRPGREQLQLALEAAVAAAASERGCVIAERALAACAAPVDRCPTRLRVLASRAFDACGKKERAAQELRRATPTAP